MSVDALKFALGGVQACLGHRKIIPNEAPLVSADPDNPLGGEREPLDIVLIIGERPEQATALAERLGLHGVEAIPCVRDLPLVRRSLTTHDISLITVGVDRS